MDYLQSRKIKGIILVVGAFLTLFLAVKSWEVIQDISAPKLDRPSITITGEGKIFIKPDIGQVSLSVISEATTVADAQKKATDAINKVFAALKENGVEEKDIKTTNYSINPKYSSYPAPVPMYYPDGTTNPSAPKIVGYTVSQSLEVKIRDLKKSGDILSKAASAGANQVGGITFTTEDPSAVQAEARAKAIEDANKKGKELEDKLGIRLGKVINFYESGGPYPIYRDYAMGKGGGGEIAPSPEIPVGENEVTVNVSITYQIR